MRSSTTTRAAADCAGRPPSRSTSSPRSSSSSTSATTSLLSIFRLDLKAVAGLLEGVQTVDGVAGTRGSPGKGSRDTINNFPLSLLSVVVRPLRHEFFPLVSLFDQSLCHYDVQSNPVGDVVNLPLVWSSSFLPSTVQYKAVLMSPLSGIWHTCLNGCNSLVLVMTRRITSVVNRYNASVFLRGRWSMPPLTNWLTIDWSEVWFLPRCMECRRGLTMRIPSVRLSVRPSVCPSNACIVTKRKKAMFRFLYHMKEHLS